MPLVRISGQRGRVVAARAGVAGFGVLAWWLALRSQGVSEATLLVSAAAYMALTAWGFRWPFLASLGVALALYLGGAAAALLLARASRPEPVE